LPTRGTGTRLIWKKENETEWNRLDAYTLAFHERVRQGYLALAADEPERWLVIDATQDKDKVQKAMRKAIMDRLKKK
jgi:dTMP kinase